MKYKWKIPNIALFNKAKSNKLLSTRIKSSLNDILTTVKLNVQFQAPVGVTTELRNNIRTESKGIKGNVFTNEPGGYAVVIEKGRKAGARRPPSDMLVQWLRRSTKGSALFAKMKKSNKKITYEGAAFVLARSIGKKGIDPNPFFDRGIDKSNATINRITRDLMLNLKKGLIK